MFFLMQAKPGDEESVCSGSTRSTQSLSRVLKKLILIFQKKNNFQKKHAGSYSKGPFQINGKNISTRG